MSLSTLTLASVLVVGPDPAPVVDEELGVAVEEPPDAVGKGEVVHVVQLAIVVGTGGGTQVEVAPAEKPDRETELVNKSTRSLRIYDGRAFPGFGRNEEIRAIEKKSSIEKTRQFHFRGFFRHDLVD